jgi:4-hydroxyacetophenone monooxygenase
VLPQIFSDKFLSPQGCRCDVASYYYSFSEDLKYDWDDRCADQSAILAYMKDIVRNHGLEPCIVLNTEVVEAKWVESAQAYLLTIQNEKGIRSTRVANIVISAVGVLHIPRMPNIPGIETFKGRLFHSSQWDSSVDLVGKRVAVIGNGSTG